MKKIILFLIAFMGSQYLFAQDFTAKELISLYDLSIKEIETAVLKKGYRPIKLPAAEAERYFIYRKSNCKDRQLSIKILDQKPGNKKLEFDTDHRSDWVAFKKEMEESMFVFDEQSSNGQQRLWWNNKNTTVILYKVQYESDADDTYKLVVRNRSLK